MSYARKDGDSDVYVICTRGGIMWCIGRELRQPDYTGPRRYMMRHLRAHLRAGQKVPQRTFKRLSDEIKQGRT